MTTGKKIGLVILGFLGLGLIRGVIVSASKTPEERDRDSQARAAEKVARDAEILRAQLEAEAQKKAAALERIDMESFKCRKEGFGNVMECDFTVHNPSPSARKDFEVVCDSFSNSGTQIDTNQRTVYEIVPAAKSRRFRDFNMGFLHTQAARVNCRVTSSVLAQ